MNIYPHILALLQADRRLAEYFIKVAEYYKTEPGIYYGCQEMASLSKDHEMEIRRMIPEYWKTGEKPAGSMIVDHDPGSDLSVDLRYLWILTMEAVLFNDLLVRALAGSGNDLENLLLKFEADTEKQAEWLSYRMSMEIQKAETTT